MAEQSGFHIDPLSQFTIKPILSIIVGGVDVSYTNSALAMTLTLALVTGLIAVGMAPRAMVPGRLQTAVEMLYEFVAEMVRDHAGPQARPYFPIVFSLFTFVLFGNLLGLIPLQFTFTSHIVVTFCLAAAVFLFVTILGFRKHGLHFLSFFVPSGAPFVLMPLIIPIEFISYLSRPISLSVRLFANMLAGHAMFKVFAYFSIGLILYLGGMTGWVLGLLSLALNVALIGFEILVAFLQAYVFTILTCLYIRDALEMHH